MTGRRIFITGGGGFIGTSLAKRLLDGNEVVVFDNLHRNAIKFSGALGRPGLKFIEGDVLDAEKVRRSMEGCDIVVHLASIAGVDTVVSMPVKTMEVAMIGTYNVLKGAMAQPRLERLIDFSTSEVFGRYADRVKESDPTPVGPAGEPRWTYAAAKLAGEHLAFAYHRQSGLPAVTIRPFNIFGPMQVGIGAIHLFAKSALKGDTLRLNNGG
jgi:nucleoside-diphosphate-sugar epimerase